MRNSPGKGVKYVGFCVVWFVLQPSVLAAPPITALAMAPGGAHVLAGSQQGLQLLSWPELRAEVTLETELDHVHDLAFSPAGTYLAVAGGRPGEYGEIEIRAWPSGDLVARNVDHDDVVYGVTWMSNTTLASASADTKVATWVLQDGALDAAALFEGHSRRVRSIAWLAQSQLLVSAGVDQSIRVWRADRPTSLRVLDHHTEIVHDLIPRPGKLGPEQIASCSRDRTVRIWQPTIGRLVRFIRLSSEPLSIAWSPQGDLLAAACVDGSVQWIDPSTVQLLGSASLSEDWLYEIVSGPADHEFAVGLADGRIRRVAYVPEAPQ